MRLRAISAKPKTPAQFGWVSTGRLFDCDGCGGRCKLCMYKEANKKVLKFKVSIDEEKIAEHKKEIDKADDQFKKKFGLLKKASVLMFYGRSNDAFDEIQQITHLETALATNDKSIHHRIQT